MTDLQQFNVRDSFWEFIYFSISVWYTPTAENRGILSA